MTERRAQLAGRIGGGRRRLLAAGVLAGAMATGSGLAPPSVDAAGARGTLYVQAKAPAGGDGSRRNPFRSLARVRRASAPGDRILVLRPRRRGAVLEGGIRLKPRQRLIGAGRARRPNRGKPPALSNDDAAVLKGDVVRLADGVVVRNLRIMGAARGAIYGRNIRRARIAGNEITGHNSTCARGFHIPPFNVPTTVPGVGIPISDGLHNGWAGIMVDADRGRSRIRIDRNYVHHSECGDGIDVRAMGRARIRARITRNRVRVLRQGSDLESVLAIGLQSADSSLLVARVRRNREGNLGNVGDPGFGPLGADSEGVFINPTGPSRIDVVVARNRYRNPRDLGGFSANGLEFVSMGDGARGRVVIRDSRFTRTPGDVLEQLALGTNARLRLRLDGVVASGSTGFARTGIGNTILIPGNNGDCMLAASGGAGNRIQTRIADSELTDCANNGLTFGSAVANGTGPTNTLDLEISRSELTGNQGANLRVGNISGLQTLMAKVEHSDLSDSQGQGVTGLANASFENLGTTTAATLDLGGGGLGSAGGNCLEGGLLAAELIAYSVTAEGNWWGAPGPPGPGRVLAVGGTLDGTPGLDSRPSGCGRP